MGPQGQLVHSPGSPCLQLTADSKIHLERNMDREDKYREMGLDQSANLVVIEQMGCFDAIQIHDCNILDV